MKNHEQNRPHRTIGRVSSDTKGPPGVFMEGGGLWNGQHLTD
jgi:hypothetical protein